MLAKRLVNDASSNDESESSMIAKLKQMCGFEYTTKLQRMFTDAGLSKEISDKYKQVNSFFLLQKLRDINIKNLTSHS